MTNGVESRSTQRIIDFHTHAFPDFLAARAIGVLEAKAPGHKTFTDGTLSGLLREMDSAGVDIAVLCSIATSPNQVHSILDWSLQIASERIIPFASVHPACSSLYETTAQIAKSGLKGIKLHPQYQGFFADDPNVFDIYKAAADHGLILMLHAGYDIAYPTDPRAQPHRIAAVARQFPGLRIVAAHMGGWQDWEQVLEHLAGTDVYFDTSFSIGNSPDDAPKHILQEILNKHSPHRLLFGTDSPWRKHSVELKALQSLNLPDCVMRAILWDNAAALLGIS